MLLFNIILLSMVSFNLGIKLPTPSIDKFNSVCNMNLFRFYDATMSASNCLQIIINDERDMNLPICIFDEMFQLQFIHIIRTVDDVMEHNIYNSSEEISTIHKQCRNFIMFSRNYRSILTLFQKSNVTSAVETRFYPSIDILLITDEEPRFQTEELNYLNENHLRALWLFRNSTNDSFSSIKNCLTNVTVEWPSFGNRSQHTFLPLRQVPNKGNPFRISLYNCPPFADYRKGPENDLQ